MKEFAHIYYIFDKPIFLFFRVVFILAFLGLSVLSLNTGFSPFPTLAVVSALLIFEVFLYFKIIRMKPTVPLSAENPEVYNSIQIDALAIFLNSHNNKIFIDNLLDKFRVKFILEKANISNDELRIFEIERNLILQKAIDLVLKIQGTSIRTSDLLISYLLLTEDQIKLLLSKDLKEEDLLNIARWERLLNPDEKEKEHLFGRGVSDDWVYGWLTETKKYMLDLTTQVLSKKRFFYPREKEYKMLLDSIASSKSIILVGEVGSGKDALVEKFVKDSFEGNLSKDLNHLRVFQFLVDLFISGVQNQGELEQRFVNIISEVSHSKDVIIFIENIETIFGSSDFNLDLSGALIPYLKEGRIRIIGSTTPANYKKYLDGKPTLMDHLSTVRVEEPNEGEAMQIFFEKSTEIEWNKGVKITYTALKKAIELGPKYLPTISLPGSGIKLLEDTSDSLVREKVKIILDNHVIAKTEEKTKIPISKPSEEEKTSLLNLESEIHKFIIDQEEAVSAISEAIRRIRSGVNPQNKPVSFLFLGPTGVGKTQTAKVVSRIYFGGEKEIIRVDMSEFSTDDSVSRFLKSESGSFLDKVFNNPFSLILLDEFEKANSKIMDLFLAALDDGRMTDDKTRTVSFKNALIVATSNAGSEFIRQKITDENSLPQNFDKELINELLTKNIFKPELINRFDQVVVFKPLSSKDVIEVSRLILSDFAKHMEKQDIYISFDESVVEKVSSGGFDPEFGARPLRRFVQGFIEDRIAREILEGKVKKGDKVHLSIDSTGNLFF